MKVYDKDKNIMKENNLQQIKTHLMVRTLGNSKAVLFMFYTQLRFMGTSF